ncbi:MAG: hypothetical protein ACTHN5_02585 [Phycisphaerae bacterium]
MKRLVGNIVAAVAALLVAILTIYASLRFLKEPQTGWTWVALLDWSVLIFSGATAGVIAYITVWGHFQKEPLADGEPRS